MQLTADDVKQSVAAHVAAKGLELRQKYGPHIGWPELQRVLADRSFVRYPCQIEFAADPLLPGEFAHPVPNGDRPEAGFTMFVHPRFFTELERVPLLVLYQLVVVNYGAFASAEDAEAFGSAALGLSKDEYYEALCELAQMVES